MASQEQRNGKTLISKLETVRQLQVSSIDLSTLNRNRVRVLAHLGEKYHRDSLMRFSEQKRAALLVCYLQDLQQELLDRLLTSFTDLLVGIFRRTERKEQTHHITHGKVLTQHIHTLRKVVKVVLDPAVPDDQVRPQVFAVLPQAELQEVYDDSGAKARPEDGQTFDLLLKHYTFLRQFLPDLLKTLEFTGTSAAKHVVQAIAVLKRMDAEEKRTLPIDASLDFLDASWRTTVETARASKDPKERRRAKRLWELGLAEQMRKLLRSSDLSVPGSRQHKVWTSYLHSETAWTRRKISWFARHAGAEDANAYLDALEERYQETLRTVLAGWDTNDFAEIVMKDGLLGPVCTKLFNKSTVICHKIILINHFLSSLLVNVRERKFELFLFRSLFTCVLFFFGKKQHHTVIHTSI